MTRRILETIGGACLYATALLTFFFIFIALGA